VERTLTDTPSALVACVREVQSRRRSGTDNVKPMDGLNCELREELKCIC